MHNPTCDARGSECESHGVLGLAWPCGCTLRRVRAPIIGPPSPATPASGSFARRGPMAQAVAQHERKFWGWGCEGEGLSDQEVEDLGTTMRARFGVEPQRRRGA